jgi:carboxymethylenebutenolidase
VLTPDMRNNALFLGAAGTIALILGVSVAKSLPPPANRVTIRSSLPSEADAIRILNSTHRHREWLNVPVDGAEVRGFVVYPERADKAPVALLTDAGQGASDWVRAVADQAAAEGYIAVVPDPVSGLGPRGGDTDSFPSSASVASALDRLGPEAVKRNTAVAAVAAALAPANGTIVSLDLSQSSKGTRIRASLPDRRTIIRSGAGAWQESIEFLNKGTGNRPVAGTNPDVPEDHSSHMLIAQALQAPSAGGSATPGGGAPRGYPMGKLPDLPAGLFTAKSTLIHSTLRREWVDIPAGDVRLHIWVEYPEGNGKAPFVLVMQQAPGLDEWQRAIADQLALQGFIAAAPDLYSGLGPNGGNYDSFEGVDAAMRAAARLSHDEIMRRYKAAYTWGMALPRASGKSASLGFCAGGGVSFEFAGDVPEINAAVVFYGGAPREAVMAKIKAPVIGFYGENDERVTATAAPAAEKMKAQGKSFEYHVYPKATHAFIMFQDMGHNREATADSWPRAIAFLNKNLK